MKKSIVVVLVISMIFATTQSSFAEEDLTIYLNDKMVVYNDFYGHPFIDENNRTQVPFRLTLEEFGAEVTWDGETQTAVAIKGDITLRVPLYEMFFYLNDQVVEHDTMPIAIDNRVYMPVRAIMEAFGSTVIWDGEVWSVIIEYSNNMLVPISYDLRDSDKLSSVKDQGNIGTCWAFASAAAVESVLLPDYEIDISEDHLSLAHGYNLAQNDGGDYHVAMSYYAGWKGPITEKEDPYGDGLFTEDVEAEVRVQEIQILPEKDFRAIKESILKYGGVESTLFLDYDIFTDSTEYYNEETYSYYYNGGLSSNHDVLIVGWDDAYDRSNFSIEPPFDGAFICRNSYGEDFGDAGYFYVSFADINIATLNILYSRIDMNSAYDHIYQTDDLGWIGTIGYGTDTAYFGNVYTPENNREKLEAVSFYATGENTIYEIYVVKAFLENDDLEEMKFVVSGLLPYSGYYTIDFVNPILLSEQFAVVIKISTPGAGRPVAVEIDKDISWLGDVDISDGYGLISADGINWSRTETLVQSNVCLKVFTSFVE